MVHGTPLPSGSLKVELAPPEQQKPCSICTRSPDFAPEEEEAAGEAARRVRPRTDDRPLPAAAAAAAFSPPPPVWAPPQPPQPGCELVGPGELACGILRPAAGYAPCSLLLERLGERVVVTVLDKDKKDEDYSCAMALAAEATDLMRPLEPRAVPPGGMLVCTARSELEAVAQAGLPRLLSCKPRVEGVEGEARAGWRVLLQPCAPPMMRARPCDIAHLRSWQQLLGERRLACALDLDDTVVKSFTLNGLCCEAKRLETELAEAAAARRLAGGGALPNQAALEARVRLCQWWAKSMEEYQTSGKCTRLSGWATPANGLVLGAEERVSTVRYVSYRVPAGTGSPGTALGCEVLLLHVSNAVLMVCIRPGWPVLREVLRSRFATVVATHATAEYAAEVVRVLEPAQGSLQLLRNGGLEGAAWRKHTMPPVQLPAWVLAEEKAAAAQTRPMLTHVVSFRKNMSAALGEDGEVPFGATSEQTAPKNFVALRGSGACSNAFVALDDLSGRGRGSNIWAAEDLARVISPPLFFPFGPPEERVLERCAEALKGVHAAFYDPRSGAPAASLGGSLASDLLERATHAARERAGLPLI